MTKRQGNETSNTRLDPGAVVCAALELLNEKGADAVSIRGVADRLGVRMNTVLWHAKTKARLLELMADAIVAGVSVDGLPDSWDTRAIEISRRYRQALLARRDGARIVAGTYTAEPATLRVAETMVDALLRGPIAEREALWTCWTIVYFTLGLVQEEQAFPDADGSLLTRALAAGEYPALARVMPHFENGVFDQRFEFGLAQIIGSLHP